MRSFPIVFLASVIAASSASALAEERLACFEPGGHVLTSAGFVAAREVAAFALGSGAGPNRPNSVQIVSSEPRPHHDWTPRSGELQIELERNGLPPSAIAIAFEPGGDPNCLTLRPLANHFMLVADEYLLYFDRDSDVVFPTWTSHGARRMAVGYRPGERFLVIDAHAEEVERDPDALSRRRADSIARDLVRAGVRWEDIVIRAHGTRGGAIRSVPSGVSEPLNRRAVAAVRRYRPASIG